MAELDVYSAQVIGDCDGVQFSNIFHLQCTDEVDFSTTMEEVATWFPSRIIPDMAKFTSDVVRWDQVVVRRLKPATTDVYLDTFSIAGDIPVDTLPSTICAIARYYCSPYEARQSNHWKIPGIPKDANNRGLMTDQGLVRYVDFIEEVTGGPYVMGQNTFKFVRPPKESDAPFASLPEIYKCFVNGCLANLRSRQEY